MDTVQLADTHSIAERLRAFARQIQPWGAMAINRDPRIERYRLLNDVVNRSDIPAGMIKLGCDTLASLDPTNALVDQSRTYLVQIRSPNSRPSAFYYFTVPTAAVRAFDAPAGVLFQLARAIDAGRGFTPAARPREIPPAWPRI